jgi:hypothetical protein
MQESHTLYVTATSESPAKASASAMAAVLLGFEDGNTACADGFQGFLAILQVALKDSGIDTAETS